ncbi:hypothetical protein ACQCSU_03175 [Pseudarthrobacter sp. O4]|uniref:ApeA N-terminal domain 1-containing protein n=1 Tax=Pseudarthrobacter sp. O4 TaxID=3418417 RepID=UPI003CEA46D2
MMRSLAPGTTVAGLVADGNPDTSWVVATLSNDPNRGLEVEIPYIRSSGDSQFTTPEQWFTDHDIPSNLLFQSEDGDITLFDCHFTGRTENLGRGTAFGRLGVREAVFHRRDGDPQSPLEVTEVRSTLDGLKEWTQFSSISKTVHRTAENRAQKMVIEVEALDVESWTHGDATMLLETTWRDSDDPSGLKVVDSVVLTSSFAIPKPVSRHLAEQRQLVALLKVMFECGVRFRSHEIRDSRYTSRLLSGEVYDRPYVALVSRATAGDYQEPVPDKNSLQHPIGRLADVGNDGLHLWNRLYSKWERVILPITAVIGRSALVEDRMTSSGIAIEAAGVLLEIAAGEEVTWRGKNPTTATYALRCISTLGLDWSQIAASEVGLARGIAKRYNSIKHPKPGPFPDALQSYLISNIAVMLVRLVITANIDGAGSLVGRYADGHLFAQRLREFEDNNLYLDDDGEFVEHPTAGKLTP